MKYVFFLSILFAVSAHAQTITPEQTKDNIGKKATVCGTVFNVHSGAHFTYINFGDAYPKQIFTVVLKNEDASKFSFSLDSLAKKNICVTGMIKSFQDKPEIDASTADQIKMQ